MSSESVSFHLFKIVARPRRPPRSRDRNHSTHGLWGRSRRAATLSRRRARISRILVRCVCARFYDGRLKKQSKAGTNAYAARANARERERERQKRRRARDSK